MSKIGTLLTSLAGVLVLGTASFAVAGPVGKSPSNWSGLYVGGVGAYGWGASRHCDPAVGPCTDANSAHFDMDGGLGGVAVGYNWQLSNLVLGIEADWAWGQISGGMPSGATFDCGTSGVCETRIDSMGTVRGRVGYAFGPLMPYATVGLAISDVTAKDAGTNFSVSGSETVTSLVWGGGIEYAFAKLWSARVEYLKVEGIDDFRYANRPGFCACYMSETDFDTLRFGLNYRLGN